MVTGLGKATKVSVAASRVINNDSRSFCWRTDLLPVESEAERSSLSQEFVEKRDGGWGWNLPVGKVPLLSGQDRAVAGRSLFPWWATQVKVDR